MKIVIFAGGIGTRLWPLSRKNSPKQFDKIFNGKSTLQLAVERVAPVFGMENILVQTAKEFKPSLIEQVPELRSENILIEPARRNVGPSVCLAMKRLEQSGYEGAVAIVWADHLMERVGEYQTALKAGEELIKKDSNRFVFLGEKPRFANNNLGWIYVDTKLGEIGGQEYFGFKGWKYKPEQDECDKMFKLGQYYWNPGYFVSSVKFILKEYKKLAPGILEAVEKTVAGEEEAYLEAPKQSFDKCLIEKTDLKDAVVIKTNMGWSDPGTLYAMKEALQKSEDENVVQGKVFNLKTKDSLVYNLEDKKLVATVGLDGMVVVNTPDALIVVPKDKVKEVTELVDGMGEEGLDKYL